VRPDQLRDLAKKTDLRSLTSRMEEFSESQPLASSTSQIVGSEVAS
jgi:hypothetical protein